MDFFQLINILIIPVFIWIIKIEKKITRIETILNCHEKYSKFLRKENENGR